MRSKRQRCDFRYHMIADGSGVHKRRVVRNLSPQTIQFSEPLKAKEEKYLEENTACPQYKSNYNYRYGSELMSNMERHCLQWFRHRPRT